MNKNQLFGLSGPVVLVLGLSSSWVYAGKPEVVTAEAECNVQQVCTVRVTLRHDDTGWDHYANQWQVLNPQGQVLATRTLHHPHVNEQPFTRSLSGVRIPSSMKTVLIRASDSVHGVAKQDYVLTLD